MRSTKLLVTLLLLLSLSDIGFGRSSKNLSYAERVDLLIVGGTVVTMDAGRRVIEDGAVAVSGGKVVAVGTRAEMAKGYRAKQTVNAAGKAVIPGLINAHTHIPMVLFRGISDDLDLNDWLTRFIFPAEAKNVDEAFVRVGTRLGLAEMIRGGTTTYADMYYFEDAIADETKKAGVRGLLGQTLIDFPVPDAKTPAEGMALAEKFVKKWQNDPLITPAIAPHAPYTISTENLKAMKALADKVNAPLIIHVAETRKEVSDITEQKGHSPMAYLDSIGFLGGRVLAAHTVFLTDAEIDLMKAKNVGSAHCPHSNMKLASGFAPVPQMLAKDIALGLGTDGAASNNDLNMWEEIDAAAKLHKVFTGDPKVVTAEQAFEMATIRGARAVHMADKIGSIETGKLADIAIVDLNGLHQTPMYNIYSHLVYTTKASDVETVIINGRVVMQNRRLLTLNESAIKKDAAAYRNKIIKSLNE
ncbi:MAG: amidohydrolase [Acidobacteria bacterium]|nr:amidohydrolase [Acidobacteriota bacterium]